MCRNVFQYKRVNNILHQEGYIISVYITVTIWKHKNTHNLVFLTGTFVKTTRVRNNNTIVITYNTTTDQ